MKKLIKNLRKQPFEIRVKIFNVLLLFSGIILLTLWSWSSLSNLNLNNLTANISEVKKNLEPISSLRVNISEGYNSISKEFER